MGELGRSAQSPDLNIIQHFWDDEDCEPGLGFGFTSVLVLAHDVVPERFLRVVSVFVTPVEDFSELSDRQCVCISMSEVETERLCLLSLLRWQV